MNTAYRTGFLLNRASWSMSRKIHKLLADRGMTEVSIGFIGVLFSLYEKDGMNITELGEEVSLEKSTMTGLIDRMEKSGLLGREPDPDDRRAYRIVLTKRGKSIKGDLLEVIEEAYKQLTIGISKKDIDIAMDVLERIISNARNNH